VRGLDYYRHTAFEFVTDRLGAQGTVLGGGRYDGLVENLGGPATAGVGWAAGGERLAMLLAEPAAERPDVAVGAGDQARGGGAGAPTRALPRRRTAAGVFLPRRPRPRLRKGMGRKPAAIVSLDVRDGARTHSFRLLDEAFAEVARARAIFEQHTAA